MPESNIDEARPAPTSTPPLGRARRSVCSDWAGFLGIVFIALGIRLVAVRQLQTSPMFEHPTMDALYHDQWARAIVADRTFVDGPYFRAPLYPAFLAGIYRVFGPGYLAPRIVQAVIGALSCGLAFVIGRIIASRIAGACAGLAAASYWLLIYFDGELLIPTLIVFLDLVLILLLLRAATKPTVWRFGIAGVVLGLSAIARPNVLLFAPAVIVWIFFLSRPGWQRALGRSLCLLVGTCLPILPVTLRNCVYGRDVVLISSQAGVNFYIGNNPDSDGKTAIVPGTPPDWWGGYYASIERAERAMGRSLKPSEVSRYYFGESFHFMRTEPARAFKLMAHKLRLFWLRWELSNNQDIYFWSEKFIPITRWLPLGFAVIGPLGVLGMAMCRNRALELFPLWGFILVYMVSVVAFFCTARYRVPIIIPLIVLGALGVESVVRLVWQREWKRLRIAAVVLVLAVAGVNVTVGGPRPSRSAECYWQLADAYERAGDPAKAIEAYRQALDAYRNPTDPDLFEAENPFMFLDMAWLLSTTPRDDLRDPVEALELLEQAALLLEPNDPGLLDGLAAAHAAGGQLDKAIETAGKAIAQAEARNMSDLANAIRARLLIYRSGRAYLQPEPAQGSSPSSF